MLNGNSCSIRYIMQHKEGFNFLFAGLFEMETVQETVEINSTSPIVSFALTI